MSVIYLSIYIFLIYLYFYLQLDWTFLTDKGDNLDLWLASKVQAGGSLVGLSPHPVGSDTVSE